MKFIQIFIIIIISLASSCTPKNDRLFSRILIDTKHLPAKQIPIDEHLDEIYLIPLQTTTESLLGRLSKYDQDQ